MQVTIYVKEDSLSELSYFLKSDIKYEHSVVFQLKPASPNIRELEPIAEIQLYYDDYVTLCDYRMQQLN